MTALDSPSQRNSINTTDMDGESLNTRPRSFDVRFGAEPHNLSTVDRNLVINAMLCVCVSWKYRIIITSLLDRICVLISSRRILFMVV